MKLLMGALFLSGENQTATIGDGGEAGSLRVYPASRDARVSWYAKLVALLVTAYALSPIDLIHDFIPVIGYLDDLVILPLGVFLVIQLVPPELMAEHRAAAARNDGLPKSWVAAVLIITLWVIGITILAGLFFTI